jgi:hypothetical protein
MVYLVNLYVIKVNLSTWKAVPTCGLQVYRG